MAAVEPVHEIPRTVPRRRTLFFVCLAGVLLALVAVGFSRSFYLRQVLGTVDRFGPSLPLYLVVHGVTLTTWYLLFAAQTLLVAMGRRGLHRQLGVAGVLVAVAVVATSLVVMRSVVARVTADGAEVSARLAFVVVSDFWLLVAFSALVAAAVSYRRRFETHKRLMLIASAFLVGPAFAVGRPIGQTLTPYLPDGLLPSTVFIVLALGALLGYDWMTRRSIERATLSGVAVVAAAFALTHLMLLGETGPAFARWLAGLPAGQ
jgi:hypothetical protein